MSANQVLTLTVGADGFNGDFKVVRDASDPACFYQVSVSDTP